MYSFLLLLFLFCAATAVVLCRYGDSAGAGIALMVAALVSNPPLLRQFQVFFLFIYFLRVSFGKKCQSINKVTLGNHTLRIECWNTD